MELTGALEILLLLHGVFALSLVRFGGGGLVFLWLATMGVVFVMFLLVFGEDFGAILLFYGFFIVPWCPSELVSCYFAQPFLYGSSLLWFFMLRG